MEGDGLHTINVLKSQGDPRELKLTDTTTALLAPRAQEQGPIQWSPNVWHRRGLVLLFHLYFTIVALLIYFWVRYEDCKTNCQTLKIVWIVLLCLTWGPPFIVLFIWGMYEPLRDMCKCFWCGYIQMWREGI